MTVMFFERSAAGQRWWQAFADAFSRFTMQMRRERKARRDRRHMMQLPDYLLRDIGLSRIEVEAMSSRHDWPRMFILPAVGWRQAR